MDELKAALDAAAAPVTFWWRDDDAGRMHPQLDALLEVAGRRRLPIALAVVPAWLEPSAVDLITATPTATVLQHGIAHVDHAPPGPRRIELGGCADREQLCLDLAAGRDRLEQAFAHRFLPVLVPPWNRIDPSLIPRFSGLAYRGWSGFAAAPETGPPRRVDTHLDLVRWRGGPRQLSDEEAAHGLTRLIAARPREPIGILSHHLVAGTAGIAVLDRLWGVLQEHPRARIASAAELFLEE